MVCSPPLSGHVLKERCGLPQLRTGERARDDEPLDLAGALEEGVDLRVAVPLLHREVLDVAVAAENLDGLFGDADRRLAGLELAHGSLGLRERLAAARHPGRTVDEQPRRVDLDGHVREHEADTLVADDGLPEGLALLGVLRRELERRPRDADGLASHQRPRDLEGAERDRLASVSTGTRAFELAVELF